MIAAQAEDHTNPSGHPSKNKAARGNTRDIQQDLEGRTGHTKSTHRSRRHAPASNNGYLFGHNRLEHARSENRKRSPPEVLHSVAQHRGAAHPLCFTNEVMEHEFPDGFKPINIESYDGTTDPAVWIEDYLLHIHMARGDDLHAIKYLALKLKGPARYWLNSLPENSIGNWEDLEDAFRDNFQGTYVRPPDADDLSHIFQQPGESAREL